MIIDIEVTLKYILLELNENKIKINLKEMRRKIDTDLKVLV